MDWSTYYSHHPACSWLHRACDWLMWNASTVSDEDVAARGDIKYCCDDLVKIADHEPITGVWMVIRTSERNLVVLRDATHVALGVVLELE